MAVIDFHHMNKVLITTDKNYIILKIPKNSVEKGLVSGTEEVIIEEDVLELLSKGKKEYRSGKLREVSSLSQLLK